METNTENPEHIISAFKDEMKKLLNTAIDEVEISALIGSTKTVFNQSNLK